MTAKSDVRIHLLLTATVQVGNVVAMARSDPAVRLRDYQEALAWWDFLNGGPDSITVCENSGITIHPVVGVDWRRIKCQTWNGQGFDPTFGKGFGEINTLQTAFDRLSSSWSERDWVIKCNGRYRVPSVSRFCEYLRGHPEFDLVADMTRNLSWCDSRFFAARVDCWNKYILPMRLRINESAGFAFEYALASAAHTLLADRGGFSLLPFIPSIHGASGSMGHSYRTPAAIAKLAIKQLLYPLKRAAFRA